MLPFAPIPAVPAAMPPVHVARDTAAALPADASAAPGTGGTGVDPFAAALAGTLAILEAQFADDAPATESVEPGLVSDWLLASLVMATPVETTMIPGVEATDGADEAEEELVDAGGSESDAAAAAPSRSHFFAIPDQAADDAATMRPRDAEATRLEVGDTAAPAAESRVQSPEGAEYRSEKPRSAPASGTTDTRSLDERPASQRQAAEPAGERFRSAVPEVVRRVVESATSAPADGRREADAIDAVERADPPSDPRMAALSMRPTEPVIRTAAPFVHPSLPPRTSGSAATPPIDQSAPVAAAPALTNHVVAVQAASVEVPAAPPVRIDYADASSGHRSAVPEEPAFQSETGSQRDMGSPHDEPRQSPEFGRLAKALAQLAPSPSDDGARDVRAMAAPVAAPAMSPPPAAIAAGPAVNVPMPTYSETPEAENVGRLVQAMRVIARPGAWEATVRLKPEHLGDVTIAVRVERNVVSAVVQAEAAGVRQWLESQEQAVRSAMAEHGLQLDRFQVQRDGQRREGQPHHDQPRRRGQRQAEPSSERFEVVV